MINPTTTTTPTHEPFPVFTRTPAPVPVRPKVISRLDQRRNLIKFIITQHGGFVPTVRTVQREMQEAGCRVGIGTVHRDLKALGFAGH